MGCQQSRELAPQDIKKICEDTRFSGAEIEGWHESFIADHPDGRMNKTDFIALYGRIYAKGDVSKIGNQLFRAFDQDDSGFIDFREFMATMSIATKGNPDEKLKWAFKLYDVDGNGYICREEAIAIMKGVYRMQGIPDTGSGDFLSAMETVETIFKSLEKDEDGRLSSIEFIEGAKKNPRIMEIVRSI